MTDAASRQDSPEDDDGRSSSEHAQGTQSQAQQGQATQTQETPQWAADQPAPAPWFLGRPGPVPQGFPPPGWSQQPPVQQGQQGSQPPAPPLPPPNADQTNRPNQAPGARPEQGQAQPRGPAAGQPAHTGQPSDRVPAWTGQAPPNPEHSNAGPGGEGRPGANPQQPPPQQTPWLDPNRYAQPGSRPPAPDRDPRTGYRPQPPQRPQEPGQRPPLSLRTRWARGLALGGALCTLITLLNGYRNFPAWLIGASVALVMSLAGLWLGAFAQRDAARQSQRAPEAVASVVWSSISTLIAVAIVAFSLVFYPQLREFSNCMRAANTIAAQTSCQQQFDNSMTFKP